MKRAICNAAIAWGSLICFACLICFCVGLAEADKQKQSKPVETFLFTKQEEEKPSVNPTILLVGSFVWLPIGITLICIGVVGVQEVEEEQQRQTAHRQAIEEELKLLKPKPKEIKVVAPPPPPPVPKKVEKGWNQDKGFQEWMKNNQGRKG